MRCWVTGIAGFLGGHLADAMLNLGHQVYGNDNFLCGDLANVPVRDIGSSILCDDSNPDGDFSLDCRDFELMRSGIAAKNIDVLIHAAATPAEGFSVFSPNFITSNVAEASVATISAAISAGVKRIVYFSSMARYGKGKPPFKEDDPTNPVDPYGWSKLYAEEQLKLLCNYHGVKWSIVVPHNVVGTRQQITPYRNVLTIFLNRLKLGLPVYIYGDGNQKRSFSPVADCLDSLIQIIDGAADGEVVNIGPDGNEMTINNLLEMCEIETGITAQRIYLPPRPLTDSVTEAHCSSDKARKLLGYQPQQSLIECIKEMSDNLRPKPFDYSFPLEITNGCPETWLKKL